MKFRNHVLFFTILTILAVIFFGATPAYALENDVPAVEIAKNFIENSTILGIDHTVVEDIYQIPVPTEGKDV